jgi:hypothetical protein
MRNCGNCVYKDLLITEEPCMRCRYTEYWEGDTEDESTRDNRPSENGSGC